MQITDYNFPIHVDLKCKCIMLIVHQDLKFFSQIYVSFLFDMVMSFFKVMDWLLVGRIPFPYDT